MKNIAIVSEGKDIAYAKPVLEMFKTQINDSIVYSSIGNSVNAELYSKQVFLHSSIPRDCLKVFVGSLDIGAANLSLNMCFSGLHIQQKDDSIFLNVETKLICQEYDSFFVKLNELDERFFDEELEYVEAAMRKRVEYVKNERSLFTNRSKEARTVQAYLYLAYYLYFKDGFKTYF